jgi:hypothetical protein
MAGAKKTYRTIFGVVQFDVKEGEAAGQTVRNIVVKQTGFGAQAVNVYATLWPKHDGFAVERGDVVALEGSYTSRDGQNTTTGEDVTYHNISVTRIAVLGKMDEGSAEEVVNQSEAAAGEPVDEGDIPF